MSKKIVFNSEWLKDPLFISWAKRHPFDVNKAKCTLCDGQAFELGNMGRHTLTSHMNGKKHQAAKSAKDKTQTYFHHKVVSAMSMPGCLYTVSFDESFSKAIQEEQMDLIVRFWDTDKNCMDSRYFESLFLGLTRASDLLRCFLKGLA
ncbi:hypothetical protein LSH36_207g01002 [Paralvinella palmiformis]|uniref:Uncharacterized protein n=1 Tax=Paralvinella palmiformis TaxID=53620 RepID=A0AAD9JQB9_9ANNE|nr:hypothetical protein LSH36_207g01002 [Paralvinella palmiformis]